MKESDDKKKELIEKTAKGFERLSADSKNFVLGYMVGVQQARATEKSA